MITLTLEKEPQAVQIQTTNEKLVVALADGRTLSVPLEWYPRLFYGTPKERKHWELLGNGYAIEWPDLDEHIGVEGLIAGRKSGETKRSIDRWLKTRNKASKSH